MFFSYPCLAHFRVHSLPAALWLHACLQIQNGVKCFCVLCIYVEFMVFLGKDEKDYVTRQSKLLADNCLLRFTLDRCFQYFFIHVFHIHMASLPPFVLLNLKVTQRSSVAFGAVVKPFFFAFPSRTNYYKHALLCHPAINSCLEHKRFYQVKIRSWLLKLPMFFFFLSERLAFTECLHQRVCDSNGIIYDNQGSNPRYDWHTICASIHKALICSGAVY